MTKSVWVEIRKGRLVISLLSWAKQTRIGEDQFIANQNQMLD